MTRVWGRAPERYARSSTCWHGMTAGGVPDDWYMLRIVDEETGETVDDVVEVNCDAGWLRRNVRTECGHGYEMDGVNGGRIIRVERIEGKFRIERQVQ